MIKLHKYTFIAFIVMILSISHLEIVFCQESAMEQIRHMRRGEGGYVVDMPENEMQKFLEKLESVKMGETYEEIINRFGVPHESYQIYGYFLFFIRYIRYYEVSYYFRKHEIPTRTDSNIYVRFYFNRQKNLFDIISSIRGLSRGEIGDKIDKYMDENLPSRE